MRTKARHLSATSQADAKQSERGASSNATSVKSAPAARSAVRIRRSSTTPCSSRPRRRRWPIRNSISTARSRGSSKTMRTSSFSLTAVADRRPAGRRVPAGSPPQSPPGRRRKRRPRRNQPAPKRMDPPWPRRRPPRRRRRRRPEEVAAKTTSGERRHRSNGQVTIQDQEDGPRSPSPTAMKEPIVEIPVRGL